MNKSIPDIGIALPIARKNLFKVFCRAFFKKRKPEKLKLGLALGSGGAKGFAHIGALKAFEENGIEFDIVAGTSIGSVVGAFYSAGYSATDIIELLKRVDFSEIKNSIWHTSIDDYYFRF